jgi:hypothetical protein
MASNATTRYVEKIREVRARDFPICFAVNVNDAQRKFEQLLINWGYDEKRITTYTDNSGVRWYTAYLSHLMLDENEELIRRLRAQATNGKA